MRSFTSINGSLLPNPTELKYCNSHIPSFLNNNGSEFSFSLTTRHIYHKPFTKLHCIRLSDTKKTSLNIRNAREKLEEPQQQLTQKATKVILKKSLGFESIQSTNIDSNNENSITSPLVTDSSASMDVNVGRICLISVAILWGTYTVAVRYLFTQPDPLSVSMFTFIRKLITFSGLLLFIPFENKIFPSSSSSSSSSSILLPVKQNSLSNFNDTILQWSPLIYPSFELGLWNFFGNLLQAKGLESLTATEAGILIQLTAIFVPILSTIGGEKLKTSTWIAAVLAIFGVVVFSVDFSTVDFSTLDFLFFMHPSFSISEGFFTSSKFLGYGVFFLSILFYSIFTVRLSTYASKHPPLKLSTLLQAFASVFSFLYLIYDLNNNGGNVQSTWTSLQNFWILGTVLYVSFFCGSIAGLGQTYGQSVVSASESQILYSTTPLWSSLFAYAFLSEKFSLQSYLGGFILIISVLIASVDFKFLEKKKEL